MSEKPSFFGIMPATVRYSKDINNFAKVLFVEITSLCDKNGYCTAKNPTFADWYDKSESSISRTISSLDKAGFIHVEIQKNALGTFRKIYPVVDKLSGVRKNALGGYAKTPDGVRKNALGGYAKTPIQKNNTSINNTSNKQKGKTARPFLENEDIETLKQQVETLQNELKKEKQKVPAKIKDSRAVVTGPRGFLMDNVSNMKYPDDWNQDLKDVFKSYCEHMQYKKGGKWGNLNTLTRTLTVFCDQLKKCKPKQLIGCVNDVIQKGNTTINIDWYNNRNQNKPKSTTTANGHGIKESYLANHDKLNAKYGRASK